MIALCQYILQGGQTCTQAALKDGPYCRHHQILRKAIASTGPESSDPYLLRRRLPFVFPEDRASVQINYFVLLQALNDRRIDAKTAGIMMRVLKATDANLKKGSLDESGKPVEQVNDDAAGQVSRSGDDVMSGSLDEQDGKLAGDTTAGLDSQPVSGDSDPRVSERADEPDAEAAAPKAEPEAPSKLDAATMAAIEEIDRIYRNDPDYADRIRDAVWRNGSPNSLHTIPENAVESRPEMK